MIPRRTDRNLLLCSSGGLPSISGRSNVGMIHTGEILHLIAHPHASHIRPALTLSHHTWAKQQRARATSRNLNAVVTFCDDMSL